MDMVVFTEPAEYYLLDIEYYIFVNLCNPQAAQRISDGILGIVGKLAEYSHITTMFVKEDGYHMTEKTKILSQKALPFRALVFG